ncbi:blue copper protein-like [Durio zibethinus]|uniref:Blue copper protein-like n=1 Tax=Durio zibethinus TaxID=66656 RepID=A0A6P5YB71_DURZI|nr:blue copper protein-like [Durio zibethinus]
MNICKLFQDVSMFIWLCRLQPNPYAEINHMCIGNLINKLNFKLYRNHFHKDLQKNTTTVAYPMASSKIFFIIAVVTYFAIPSSLATEFRVGDEKGWSLDFDYQGWAAGKEFHVGDKLVFVYTPGAHNVLRVNGTEFQQCAAADNVVPLTTGNDVITLATPGRKWYICGVARHCAARNMKLSITVLSQVGSPSSAPASAPNSPTSPSAARGNAGSSFYAWIVVMVSFAGLVLV